MYCFMMLLSFGSCLLVEYRSEPNLAMKIKKLDLETNVFLQTKKICLVKTPKVIVSASSIKKYPFIQGILNLEEEQAFGSGGKPPTNTHTEKFL